MMNKRIGNGVGRIRCRVLRKLVGGDLLGVVTSLPLMKKLRAMGVADSFFFVPWNGKCREDDG